MRFKGNLAVEFFWPASVIITKFSKLGNIFSDQLIEDVAKFSKMLALSKIIKCIGDSLIIIDRKPAKITVLMLHLSDIQSRQLAYNDRIIFYSYFIAHFAI